MGHAEVGLEQPNRVAFAEVVLAVASYPEVGLVAGTAEDDLVAYAVVEDRLACAAEGDLVGIAEEHLAGIAGEDRHEECYDRECLAENLGECCDLVYLVDLLASASGSL